jgi:hypothetical protein
MPTEVCWHCKKRKPGVQLCGDDRLCRECDDANRRELSAIRKTNSVEHIDSNESGKIILESKTKEKKVSASRKKSSTLTSTNSSVNDTSTSSRCSSPVATSSASTTVSDQNAAVGICVSMVTGPARLNGLLLVKKVVWSELLGYIHFYRDKSNINALRQVVLDFFSAGDISDGKKIMALEFSTVDGAAQFLVDRRNSTVRQAHEAELDDVLGIFDAADAVLALDGYFFAASRLDQLPKFGPEEVNLGVVVERQVKMDSAIQSLSASIHQLSNNGSDSNDGPTQQAMRSLSQNVDLRLADFTSTISARLDHLQAVCAQLANSTSVQSNVRASPARVQVQDQQQSTDRSSNVVVFGVKEDRVVNVWRQALDAALSFVMGHTVDVVDAYRIGRFDASKTRPIIVKLRSLWDRRIIVSNSYKLKNFTGRIFISPDEPLEERRKRTFDRIKYRAERACKEVVVNGDILSIDGVMVFSLENGNLIQNG